ncbi:hypothetical protein [Levilactobacillus yonginensis]|uniref:hypothetical protein n=1 Tax=Levilactobacillus yonginensis TaxID=1054041 RepID=UPI00345DC135
MNMKRMVTLLLATVTVSTAAVTLGTQQVAAAKTRYTIRTFPKRMRGTWYTYSGGRYYRVKITAKKISGAAGTWHLHPKKVTASTNFRSRRHRNWIYGTTFKIDGEKWTWTYGWTQGAGAGDYYRGVAHRLNGKTYHTLQLASGAKAWTDGYAYHSKRAAKKYANRFFGNERLRDDF